MKILKSRFNVILFIGILYLVINFGVLLWFWIDPDGLGGFFWFFTLWSGVFYLFYIGLLVIAGFFSGAKGWKRWFYSLLIGVLAIVLMGVEMLPVFFIAKKVSDKTKYSEKSAKYITQGRYEKAYEYSEGLYTRSLKNYDNKFWFLRYLFLKTSAGEELLKERQFNFKINYAFCLSKMGIKSLEAERVFEECDQIAKQYLPDDPEFLLLSLGGRSELYFGLGEIVKSEDVYNEITGLLHVLDSKDRFMAVNAMLMRVMFLQRHGEYLKAHRIVQEALSLYDLEDAPKSAIFFQLAMMGVQSYIIQGELEKAWELILLSEPAAKRRKKDLSYLNFLALKGRLLDEGGMVNEAEETYLELIDRGKDKSEIVYSEQLIQMAGFYYRQGKFRQALPLFEESIRLSSSGDADVQLKQKQLQGLALINYALGNTSEAVRMMATVDSTLYKTIDQYLEVLEAGQKDSYLLKVQSHLNLANSVYFASGKSKYAARMFNNVLFTKSLAFFSNRHLEHFLSSTQNEHLKVSYRDIHTEKKELEEKMLMSVSARNESLQSMERLLLKERNLLNELTSSHGYKPFSASEVKWEDVRASLDSTEVVVEFFHSLRDPLDSETDYYFALIVEPNSYQPEIVSLASAHAIDQLLEENEKPKDHVNSLYSGENLKALNDMILQPLAHKLKDKERVYFSLSGVLHQISFPALTIDEPYESQILTSSRSLVDDAVVLPDHQRRVVLMGDLDYHTGPRPEVPDSIKYITGEFRHNESQDLISFQDLPGTKRELSEIGLLLDDRGISAHVFSREKGTEKAFRSIEGMNTDIIHLATHGFYYPKDNSVVMMDRLFGIGDFLLDIDNPMMRSGLMFSPETGDDEASSKYDGVVTANEIAAMDFSGVNLVVLSACQSGLGDVLGSEGVFGLQRAFKMAGAEKLIVSLWKVPDQATAELMTEFYNNYLDGGDADGALRMAQKLVRQKYPEPFYWAGFCVVN